MRMEKKVMDDRINVLVQIETWEFVGYIRLNTRLMTQLKGSRLD